MKKRTVCISLALLLLIQLLSGCGANDEAVGGTGKTAINTTQNTEVADSQLQISNLAGAWEVMGGTSPGHFPSAIYADERGQLVLESIMFTYNGTRMYPQEIEGDWVLFEGKDLALTIHVESNSGVVINYSITDYTSHTMTLNEGGQSCSYVRIPDPGNALRGVDASDPEWNAVWEAILSRLEGSSWVLINEDAAENYPAVMDIYGFTQVENYDQDIRVEWQGSSYQCHWYLSDDGRCFCIDINDNFDQLTYFVEVDENYLVMTRRINENTNLMQSAYYYNSVASTDVGEPGGQDTQITESPDDTWVHDYQPGMENAMSSYTRPQRTNIAKLSPIVRQDQMLYFVSNGILRKMPVGGSVVNVQGIYAFGAAFLNPKEIQVVGDWIYVRYEYSASVIQNKLLYYQQAVARISTDGSQSELVICDMAANSDSSSNTFVVRGDDIYYTYTNCVQTSATQFTYYSGLKQRNMSTGEEFVLYEQAVERYDYSLEIAAYTEDTILLGVPTSSWGDADYYLYDYDTGTLTSAPQITCSTQLSNYKAFYVDGNCYLTYYHDNNECHLYRYAPETGYEQELYFSEEYSWSADDPDWNYVLCVDGGVYASTRKGIVAIRDGQRYLLTPDPAVNIRWIGDGYIYYECNGGFYRILPDGTGWESVDWYIQ